MSPALRRVRALVKKELLQVVRDPSSIAIAIVLPALLLLLFGYGVSLDVTTVRVAVVVEADHALARELAAGLTGSPTFEARLVRVMAEGERLLAAHEVDGIVRLPADLTRDAARGEGGQVQLVVHGADANQARIIRGATEAALARRAARLAPASGPRIDVRSRLWWNENAESRWFIVPGLIVLIMTLIGALLTALVVAREWERGTMESLFVTPVRPLELLAGKTLPYFALGLAGLALSVVTARALFGVPLRGSVLVLLGVSSLYLLVALGIGLLISSATRSQFVATQLTMLITFLPAFLLSGFIYDVASMPPFVRWLTLALPARYFVTLLQTVFLAGDVWGVLLPNGAVLALMALVLVLLTRRLTRKTLG